jgi:hypothetical protein
MKRTKVLSFLVIAGHASFGLSLAFPFVFHMMVLTIDFYWIFYQKKQKPNELGINPSLYNVNLTIL